MTSKTMDISCSLVPKPVEATLVSQVQGASEVTLAQETAVQNDDRPVVLKCKVSTTIAPSIVIPFPVALPDPCPRTL